MNALGPPPAYRHVMEHDNPFTAEVVDAVISHMNDDHAEDNLRICRGLGHQPSAETAKLVALGTDGLVFEVCVDGSTEAVSIGWPMPVTTRADIRHAVVALHDQACDALGITTPPTGEH